ncbi:MAG: hypothetical protein LUG13_06790 [Oscillospiraceae bacterium]|nr:hypothetical protein [Oscillospiraceae bacterium]
MKKTTLVAVTAAMVSISLLAGCSSTEQTVQSSATPSVGLESEGITDLPPRDASNMPEDAIYGEIASVQTDSITLSLGTMAQQTLPDADAAMPMPTDGTDTADFAQQGGSLLELTGESQEIAITDATEITRRGMGGGMGGGNRNGTAPTDASAMPSDAQNASAPTGGGQMELESTVLTLADLTAGDTVMVTLNDDGSAATITVMTTMGGEMGGPNGAPDAGSIPAE